MSESKKWKSVTGIQPEKCRYPYLAWTGDVTSPSLKEERAKSIVNLLRDSPMDMSVAGLLEYVLSNGTDFGPAKGRFFKNKIQIKALLNLIYQDKRGRQTLEEWAEEKDIPMTLVNRSIAEEMDGVKSLISLPARDIDISDITGFNFSRHISDVLKHGAPRLSRILHTAAQSSQAAARNKQKSPEFICAITFAQLAHSRSLQSNLLQQITGLFLYATATSKSTIDFLSCCGLSVSYNTILAAHESLSESLMKRAAKVARGPHMIGNDNEQISMSRHISQRPGSEPTVRSFTASIIYTLRNATPEACQLGPILEQKKTAQLITYEEDILPSRQERASIFQHLLLDIIEILFKHVKGFQRAPYSKMFTHKAHRPPDKDFKTEEFVCRTVEIDESTTAGCIKVKEEVYLNQCKIDDNDLQSAIVCVNDQATNSRDRAAVNERAGDLSPFLRMELFQLAPGFFHVLLNLLWHLLEIHMGTDNVPGTLSYYISLGIKRVHGTHPDYYTVRSLFLNVLSANILHLWALETGFSDLEVYAESNPSSEDLLSIAGEILSKYASDSGLRNCTGSALDESDILLRNSILLNRDLLYYYELNSAVSSGDFGRVEILLGTLTRLFNGAGGKNYSLELLHFIQNLKYSWPEAFANIMRDNVLISIKGQEDHYMGVDLNIEHNINLQKKYFTAKGVHGSAEHLSRIAPVTRLYRDLRTKVLAFCGGSWAGITHTEPNQSTNIKFIRSKLQENHIYDLNLTRGSYKETTDILKKGGNTLAKTGIKVFRAKYRKGTGTQVERPTKDGNGNDDDDDDDEEDETVGVEEDIDEL